jgi:hypothetical protein
MHRAFLPGRRRPGRRPQTLIQPPIPPRPPHIWLVFFPSRG